MNNRTNPSAASKPRTTTRGVLAALFLLMGCADDPSADDVAGDVNSKIVACDPGAWSLGVGDFKQCAIVCQSKPPVNPEPVPPGMSCCDTGRELCEETRWFDVEGHPGVCGASFFEPVIEWRPCYRDGAK